MTTRNLKDPKAYKLYEFLENTEHCNLQAYHSYRIIFRVFLYKV